MLTFAIPISMGCFESPLESAVNDDGITLGDTSSSGDSSTDSGTVEDTTVDTTDPGDPEPARVLGRESDEVDSNPIWDLLNSVTRLVTNLFGGVISLVDMTLEIPAQALDRNTIITTEIPDPNFYVYEFGPDGLQFNIPATITISYDNADLNGIDESKIRLAWWDEANSVWVDMPCSVNQTDNIVTGQISHFSSYGLISD